MLQISALSLSKVRKVASFCLSATVFCFGVVQIPLNAHLATTNNNLLISQTSETITNEILEKKSIALLDALKSQQYEAALKMLSPELANQLSSAVISQMWQNITTKTGKIQEYDSVRVINTPKSDVVIVETKFDKTTNDFILTYNEDGEIIGVNLPGLESVEQISQDFVVALIDKDYRLARLNLHPFLKEELFADQIQEQWESVIERNGLAKSIKDITVLSQLSNGQKELVSVTVEFEQGNDDILIIFDENQLITGVDMAVE